MKKILLICCLLFISTPAFAGTVPNFGIQDGIPTSCNVGITNTLVRSATQNTYLQYIVITNISDENIWISYGGAATINQGIVLSPNNNGIIEYFAPGIPRCDINAISQSGNKKLSLLLGY